MQVRVCPKCGTENQRSRSSCANCYTSLVGVQLTASKKQEPEVTVVGAPAPQTPAAAPEPDYIAPVPKRSYSEGGEMYRPAPAPDKGSGGTIAAVALIILLIAGMAFAVLRKPAEPKVPADKVVVAFLEAKKTGDLNMVKLYLSEESIARLDSAFSSKAAQSAGFTKKDAYDMVLWGQNPRANQLKRSTIVAEVVKDDTRDQNTRLVQVVLKSDSKDPQPALPTQPAQAPAAAKFDFKSALESLEPTDYKFVVVREGGEWKVDLDKSNRETAESTPVKLMPK